VASDFEVLKAYGSPKYTTYIGSEDARPHGVVVWPLSTEEVVAIVYIARKWGVPIVPFGNGTSLEGHTGGVSGPFTSQALL
jgi:FAD/FMN-containing dehydrogenase